MSYGKRFMCIYITISDEKKVIFSFNTGTVLIPNPPFNLANNTERHDQLKFLIYYRTKQRPKAIKPLSVT